MIPNVGPGETAEEIVLSRFNYAELDKSSNRVRVRLNSTVENVQHVGDPNSSSEVLVNYINDNKSYQVRGKGVVMGLLQHDESSHHPGSSQRAIRGIEEAVEGSFAIHHRGGNELAGQ